MSNASRFDRAELLSGPGGNYMRYECLRPVLNILQCQVRTMDEKSPWLEGTKVILLLGKDCYETLTGDKQHTLGEVRGSIYYVNGIPSIPSYLPQDCLDHRDYEQTHNTLLQGKNYLEEGAEHESSNEKRRHGITSRSNWAFWLKADTRKALRILANGGNIPQSVGWFKPEYRIYPSASDVIKELTTVVDRNLYLDLETDENFGLKCIGYSLDNTTISVIPILNYEYKFAYPEVPEILRAFCVAANNNTLVSHNGSGFDFLVLPWKYGLPIGRRFYDTMLATHRCYPDIEKSLGHCTSLWTYEPFHKDEGSGEYHTYQHMVNLMQYCGKDVYTMMLIKRAIDDHAARIPGLTDSINQVMDSIPAYRLMTLMGIRYKQELLDEIMLENDELMMQYNRMIDILIGEQSMAILNRKSKKSVPGSNTKMCHYFHEMLDYKVQGKSPKTGKPSLAKKNLYKLRLKYNNPVIDIALAYRATQKESGSLKFTPWRTDANHTPQTNN